MAWKVCFGRDSCGAKGVICGARSEGRSVGQGVAVREDCRVAVVILPSEMMQGGCAIVLSSG